LLDSISVMNTNKWKTKIGPLLVSTFVPVPPIIGQIIDMTDIVHVETP